MTLLAKGTAKSPDSGLSGDDMPQPLNPLVFEPPSTHLRAREHNRVCAVFAASDGERRSCHHLSARLADVVAAGSNMDVGGG